MMASSSRATVITVVMIGAVIIVSLFSRPRGGAYDNDPLRSLSDGGGRPGGSQLPSITYPPGSVTPAPPIAGDSNGPPPSSSSSSSSSSPGEAGRPLIWARGSGGRIVRNSFSSPLCSIRPSFADPAWSIVCGCGILTSGAASSASASSSIASTSERDAAAQGKPKTRRSRGGGGAGGDDDAAPAAPPGAGAADVSSASASLGARRVSFDVEFAQPVTVTDEMGLCAVRQGGSNGPSAEAGAFLTTATAAPAGSSGCKIESSVIKSRFVVKITLVFDAPSMQAFASSSCAPNASSPSSSSSSSLPSSSDPAASGTSRFGADFDLKLQVDADVASSWQTCAVSLGDFGSNKPDARRVAELLENIVSKRPDIRGILSTGDNFYPVGVKGVNDPQFKNVFESLYGSWSLKKLPWALSLGNHDQWGFQGQLQYGKKSDRWILPQRWYTMKIPMHTVIPSSSPSSSTSPSSSPFRTVKQYVNFFVLDTYGAELDKQLKSLANYYTAENRSRSNPDWRVVIGHVPVYSGSAHGQEPDKAKLRRKIVAFVQMSQDGRTGAHAYMNGDDHLLEVHSVNGTEYFTSGAGGGSSPYGSVKLPTTTKSFPLSLGFMVHCWSAEEMTTQFVVADGKRWEMKRNRKNGQLKTS